MSFGQIVLGILLFALATAVLYVWGLKKSMTQEADLERILLNKCAGTVVKYLRKHGSITQKEMPPLIQGVRAGMFWSKNRIRVQDPGRLCPQADPLYAGAAAAGGHRRPALPVERVTIFGEEFQNMNVLEHLEPKSVFRFFEEMCAIPHGSRNTKAVSDWCADFARTRGLEYHQDRDNNIIIIKEATPGYEAAPPVILQGHMDMVCEQTADCQKDMSREGLDLAVDGDFVYAKDTTLGGDDGIAIAMALALLDAEDLPHPRLEAVFTVDEEIGLLGAASIDVAPLKGRQMLNLDSEAEGIFTVSCAGGNTSACRLPLTRAPFDGAGVTIAVGGLTGGHSGAEIHKGRANANVLMGRILRAAARRTELRLLRVDGGLKDNAIPVACTAQVVAAEPQAVMDAVREMEAALNNEYRATDPALWIRAEECAPAEQPWMSAPHGGSCVCSPACPTGCRP